MNVISTQQFGVELMQAGCGKSIRGVSILSSGSESLFTWHDNKFKKIVVHPAHGLPEMALNSGFSKMPLYIVVDFPHINFVEMLIHGKKII